MRYRWLSRPQLWAFTLLALVLVTAVACGAAQEADTTSPADQATTAAPAMSENTPSSSAGESMAATAVPESTAVPDTAVMTRPRGTLTFGLPLIPPFHVFPTVTEGTGYHHNGFTTGETRLYMNEQKETIPRLIKEWSVEPDATNWTFKLEEGVQFHKGYGEMDAEGVIWSMMISGGESSRVAYNTHIRRLWGIGGDVKEGTTVTGIIDEGRTKAIDKYTIQVNTGSPQYDTLSVLAFVHINIFSQKQLEDVGVEAASRNIAATGPWEIKEHKGDQFTKWAAVPDHWRKTPEFAEMVWQHIPEESTRIANFQTGQLTAMEMNLDSIPAVQDVPGISLMRIAGGSAVSLSFYGNYYVGIENGVRSEEHKERVPGYDPSLPWISGNEAPNSEEWKNAAKVRTALSIAIDRQLITDTLLSGEAIPDPLPAWAFHLDKLPPEYRQWEFNPEKSRQLLTDAGYPDGFTIDLTPLGGSNYLEVTAAIAQMWDEIGVKSNQQNMPYKTFRPGIVTRTYNQAYQHTHVAVDPLDRWAVAFNHESAWNFGVDHPFLRDTMKQAQGTVDSAQRFAIMAEGAKFMYDNALTVGLYAQNLVFPLDGNTEPWNEHLNYAETRDLTAFEHAPNLSQQ